MSTESIPDVVRERYGKAARRADKDRVLAEAYRC